MTQEEIKNQFIQYAEDNMNNLTILEGIKELLDNVSNELYYDGYVATSNKLATCSLEIGRIIEND